VVAIVLCVEKQEEGRSATMEEGRRDTPSTIQARSALLLLQTRIGRLQLATSVPVLTRT
jgi:hypothetical protein